MWVKNSNEKLRERGGGTKEKQQGKKRKEETHARNNEMGGQKKAFRELRPKTLRRARTRKKGRGGKGLLVGQGRLEWDANG